MELITVILRFCTLLDGIPHGVALIYYINLEIKELSFDAVGVFDRGKLHNGPLTLFN
jgi:hypothetical protein